MNFNGTGKIIAGTVMAGLFSATVFASSELTVYTAVEAEDLKKYAARFNDDHPDIKINWVRDSTGIVTAKLLAEKENPQADVIWGLAATSLLLMKGEGMLEAYTPKGLEGLDEKFQDKSMRALQSTDLTPQGLINRMLRKDFAKLNYEQQEAMSARIAEILTETEYDRLVSNLRRGYTFGEAFARVNPLKLGNFFKFKNPSEAFKTFSFGSIATNSPI